MDFKGKYTTSLCKQLNEHSGEPFHYLNATTSVRRNLQEVLSGSKLHSSQSSIDHSLHSGVCKWKLMNPKKKKKVKRKAAQIDWNNNYDHD
jgi:hypothetical protein